MYPTPTELLRRRDLPRWATKRRMHCKHSDLHRRADAAEQPAKTPMLCIWVDTVASGFVRLGSFDRLTGQPAARLRLPHLEQLSGAHGTE
jgi:hypothetical protein